MKQAEKKTRKEEAQRIRHRHTDTPTRRHTDTQTQTHTHRVQLVLGRACFAAPAEPQMGDAALCEATTVESRAPQREQTSAHRLLPSTDHHHHPCSSAHVSTLEHQVLCCLWPLPRLLQLCLVAAAVVVVVAVVSVLLQPTWTQSARPREGR